MKKKSSKNEKCEGKWGNNLCSKYIIYIFFVGRAFLVDKKKIREF